jgi:hypothetical protein
VAAGAAGVVVLALYPALGGLVAKNMAASRASERLGRRVTIEHGRAGLGRVVLEGISVEGAAGGPALAVLDRVAVPFGVAFGGAGPIRVAGLRAHVVRGGGDDNIGAILAKLRGRGAAAGARSDGGAKLGVVIEGGAVDLRDRQSGLVVSVAAFDGEALPGVRAALRMRGVRGVLALAGDDQGPRFGADELDLEAPLEGMHPHGVPSLRVKGGFATPLPTLSLTGIAGAVAAGASGEMVIDLRGSYGGAREALWTAKGRADPGRRTGTLSLRAEQFSLDKIADVLPRSVLSPGNTTLDAAFDVTWKGDAFELGGDVSVVGLSLQHDAVASEPVTNLSLGLSVRGTAYPARRRLELQRLEARVRDLAARVSGTIELPAGSYKFADGRKLGVVPKIDLALAVPKISCAKLLSSIPEALTPRLQGFVLKGTFEAAVSAKIDFADLDALELGGKVGIDGCKVASAPADVTALAGPQSIVVDVEVPEAPGGSGDGDTETLSLVVGPDNPDFVPYDQISPYLVSSILTTEDNGFFKHRGWVTSEFKSALRRNLERGGFRLGASSITMQMVKNVLLSQEKTLSRKLQELFLVWYIEQILPKERILELYFNAIEFGPRIYGIGAATRHYFGKRPAELTPLEAAFFSSILPSPKRRYVQYCHGALSATWDKYVRRILSKVHERGRITDDEYAAWSVQPFVFDRREATFTEKQCQEWVKQITARPEPEAPPDLDDDSAANDTDAAAWSQRKLRKLFVRRTAKSIATRAQ